MLILYTQRCHRLIGVLYTKKCNKKCTGLRDETIWSFMFVIAYNVFSIMNAAEHLTLDTVCSDVLINFNSHDMSVFLVNYLYLYNSFIDGSSVAISSKIPNYDKL